MADTKTTPAAKPKKAAAKPAAKPVATTKAAPKASKPAPAAAPRKPAGPPLNPYDIIFHPVVTEKTMFAMDRNNSLEFLVAIDASKPQILEAVEQLFTVKVFKVTTRITKDGKRAMVRFTADYSAEDIGTRIGVF